MNFSKLLINNQHNSPHQLRHLSNLQQHQHPVRQITPNHQHVFHFKKTHIYLKKTRSIIRTFDDRISPRTSKPTKIRTNKQNITFSLTKP